MLNMSKDKPSCLLVLDANILIKDFWWKSETFNYLQDRMFLLHALVIPKISLEESKEHLIRRAQDLKVRMDEKPESERLLGQYRNLYNRSYYSIESPEELGDRYEKYIIERLSSFNGFIANNAQVNMEDILKRSIKRIKLFNKGDKGFRDTILWLSVIELVKKYQKVSFVSENINDFADKSSFSLHVELEKELQEHLPEHVNFFYFKSLDAFSAQMDKDKSAGAKAFGKALMMGGYKKFELISWLTDNLVEKFSESSIDDFDGVQWAGLPYWAEAPRLIDVEELIGIETYREKFISEDVVEFYIDIALVGLFACMILTDNWEGIVFHNQVEMISATDYWTNVNIRSIGAFVIKLTFDIKSEEVLSFYGVPLESDFEKALEAIEVMIED